MLETSLTQDDELDAFVAAFEAVQRRDGGADIAEFLPNRSHPLFLAVLRELVRVDLEFSWSRGRPLPLEDYERVFPELFADLESRAAVEFEERRLREQAEQASCETPVVESRVAPPTSWPNPGDYFAEFHLLSELGRGSFARVYLARQAGLASRLVVLKISGDMPGESGTLARLQHTNIVPVFSVHRQGRLHAICMPYYGSTTLADVLQQIQAHPSQRQSLQLLAPTVRADNTTADLETASFVTPADDSRAPSRASSQEIVERPASMERVASDEASAQRGARRVARRGATRNSGPQPSVSPDSGAPRGAATFGRASSGGTPYVASALRIVAQLADGLQHAHDRGIIHRDLKPANILLADDGQPMLLDFNLSDDAGLSVAERGVQGGTLPYMAPEVLRAFQRHQGGGDARSDIYALGIVLYELLAGRHPFPIRTGEVDVVVAQVLADHDAGMPRLIDSRRGITPAVAAIVARCLAPLPTQRYQAAAELREDIERHLQNLPLRHATEPSWIERGRKWLRRHPRLTSATSIATLALVAIAVLAVQLTWRGERLAHAELIATLDRFCQGVRSAEVAMLEAETATRRKLDAIAAECRRPLIELKRLEARDPDGSRLNPAQFTRLQVHKSELFFLLAALTQLQAERPVPVREMDPIRQHQFHEALLWNERAVQSAIAPIPLAFFLQRSAIYASLGRVDASMGRIDESNLDTIDSPVVSNLKGRTAKRDSGLLACWYMAQRRYQAALPHWRQATRDDPQNAWSWYGLGCCHELLQQPDLATAAFCACIAIDPDRHAWYFHRGVARLRQQDFEEAARDFAYSLYLRPDHVDSRINLAIAWLGEHRYSEAIDKLQPLVDGPDRCRVLLLLADAHEQLQQAEEAEKCRAAARDSQPLDADSWIARGVSRASQAPELALEDFDRALSDCPHSLEALENKAHIWSERLNEPDKAIATLSLAIEMHPEAASARCARGVLLARAGRFDEARDDARRAVALRPSPEVAFQAAGVYALSSTENTADADTAYELLTSALRRGFGLELVNQDADLAPLRSTPKFQELVQAVRTLNPAPPTDAAPASPAAAATPRGVTP